MNLSGVRDEIADALTGVDGLTGYATPPKVLRTGDALVRLGALSLDGPYSTVTWQVIVLQNANDEVAQIEQLETILDDLLAALRPVGHVTEVVPITYPVGRGTVPAIQLTMIRE